MKGARVLQLDYARATVSARVRVLHSVSPVVELDQAELIYVTCTYGCLWRPICLAFGVSRMEGVYHYVQMNTYHPET